MEVQGGESPVLQVKGVCSKFGLHIHFPLLLVEQENIPGHGCQKCYIQSFYQDQNIKICMIVSQKQKGYIR